MIAITIRTIDLDYASCSDYHPLSRTPEASQGVALHLARGSNSY